MGAAAAASDAAASGRLEVPGVSTGAVDSDSPSAAAEAGLPAMATRAALQQSLEELDSFMRTFQTDRAEDVDSMDDMDSVSVACSSASARRVGHRDLV